MIIDFHTHIFPESIAEKTIKLLSNKSGLDPYGNGTLDDLLKKMKKNNIDYSVILPIATKPEQVKKINKDSIELNKSENIISFGTIHPDMSSKEIIIEELENLKNNGVKGIKLHPEYQEFYPDDEKMTVIYETCAKLGLIISIHGGKDYAYNPVRSTPERLAEITKVKDLILIIAHMGGMSMWDEVVRYLLGLRNVYFDTAFCMSMENWQMKEIILGHGAYKILFGSDYPWENPSLLIEKIKSLDIGQNFENMIFYQNAQKLLLMK